MMNTIRLPLGVYQASCYVIYEENSASCCVLDPGGEAKKVLELLQNRNLTLEAILLTHGHFDHVGAVERLVAATGCKLWMAESDWSQFPSPVTEFFYPLANCDFTEVQFFEDAETIRAGGLEFLVIATPGHTFGSVCFRCGNILLTGDTLFAGGCGRTDLPGGDSKLLRQSLARLAQLEGNPTVYPGHGESTTLAQEKQYNPYMR
jgi:glyoxylase-like metal-dependent hydrolase (beta-lactamase superfamily II)